MISENREPATVTSITIPIELVEAPVKLVKNPDNIVTVVSTADVTSPDSQQGQSPCSDEKKILKMSGLHPYS